MNVKTKTTRTPQEILHARAMALSKRRQSQVAPVDSSSIEVVAFRLAHERYAIEQIYAREICPLKDLTPLPCTPAFLVGIVNLRGQILPVIDIKKFFDLPESGITDLHRVIVVRDGDVELGILADTVEGVKTIPQNTIASSLPTLSGIRAAFLKGVTADQVVILDVPRILSDAKIVVNDETNQ